jgi:hypothetical protein
MNKKEHAMNWNLRIIGVSLALIVTVPLGLGCAQLPQLLAARKTEPAQLEARGPGTVFASIEAAAVDSLTYAYLQAQAAHDTELMRGGTIYATRGGYSYGEIHVARPLSAHRVTFTLKPQDVARFLIYSRDSSHDVNPANERPSRPDRRSVNVIDPLHRPIYILHPSLVIREYRGEDHEIAEVADLRHPTRTQIFASGR